MESRFVSFRALRHGPLLDRLAIGLSGLCVIHCVGTAILVAFLASVGGVLLDPAIHEVGLILAIGLAALGLGRGLFVHRLALPSLIGGTGLALMTAALLMPHGNGEMIGTILGVSLVALGHRFNARALR